MSKSDIKFFREGQILRNNSTNAVARLDGILKMKLVSINDDRIQHPPKRYVYKYILKSVSGIQKVEVLNARMLVKNWSILVDTPLLTSTDKVDPQRRLDVAIVDENYELCAALRDRLKTLENESQDA